MKPCCTVSPVIFKGDGKKYCLECDSPIVEQKNIDDLDWNDLFAQATGKSDLKCQCGSESVGSNKHSTWCQKFEK